MGKRVKNSHAYACRITAVLLVWLALVLWGSALVALSPAMSPATIPGYRVLASALAPFGMVWAFWVQSPLYALCGSAGLAACGGLFLVLHA
ncbi:hypothetical protein [Acetobacter fabarum]|uniref:hypothetical protein n=1 Tax=Acetobacter fabarum TaxID=483199 RepID=UPI001177DF5F|nr:hypothetical protein [Acetobacter fabarum]